jgi:CMP-N,N'-diacetyllegionaminic acid synthase
MRVIGLIPARGGSEGIPRKNVRSLGGQPLIHHTITHARASERLARIVVTTDDAEIADVARSAGAEVPFLRPRELAANDTSMVAVVRHAIHVLEGAGDQVDAICLLQPTTPFREAGLIDRCIDLFLTAAADAVVTVRSIPTEHHPWWAYVPAENGTIRLACGADAPIARRQDLCPAYHRDGAVYVTARNRVVDHGSLYGPRILAVPRDGERHVNLDTMSDWSRALEMVETGAAHS